ncbi:MAG: hypothetical protein ACHQ50_06440 [Fimbriimonadales bacterium]
MASTVGLAIIGAYWFLVILFILLSLIFSFLVASRTRAMRHGPPVAGIALGGLGTALFGAGAGIEGHPGWALAFSILAIAFSLWWLNNMAKRDGG